MNELFENLVSKKRCKTREEKKKKQEKFENLVSKKRCKTLIRLIIRL